MKKAFVCFLSLSFILLSGVAPAHARACSMEDTDRVRALLVPITRLSAQQGRNTAENQEVITSIRNLAKSTSSLRLRNSLSDLRALVKKGELNQGSTFYWGYRDGSVWKTYKKVLVLTQKNTC